MDLLPEASLQSPPNETRTPYAFVGVRTQSRTSPSASAGSTTTGTAAQP